MTPCFRPWQAECAFEKLTFWKGEELKVCGCGAVVVWWWVVGYVDTQARRSCIEELTRYTELLTTYDAPLLHAGGARWWPSTTHVRTFERTRPRPLRTIT